MAKVTFTEKTAGEAPKGSGLVYVTDGLNRKLGLRKLPFLEEFRIVEALGAETSSNTTYMGMLQPLLYLAEVDGNAIEIPKTKLACEALIQLAGREGYAAVCEGIVKHFVKSRQETDEKIKNSHGTPA